MHHRFVIEITYEGDIDTDALEEYLEGALDSFIEEYGVVYIDHHIHEETDDVF